MLEDTGMEETSSSSRARLRGNRLMVPQATHCLATSISIRTQRRQRRSTQPTTRRASRNSPHLVFKELSPRPCPTGNSSHHRNIRRTAPHLRPPRPTTHRKLTTPLPMPVRPRHSGSLHITVMDLQTLAMEVLLRHPIPRLRTATPPDLLLRHLSNSRPTLPAITPATPSLLRVLRFPVSVPRPRQLRTIQLSLLGPSSRMEAALDNNIRKHRTPQRHTCLLGPTATIATQSTIEIRGPILRPPL